ncbi:YceH family protein [Phytopseudomonas dryadis]|uniref:DUF480 domain-containing protein n=1 Tax=Phytopseudomonas dryadis TaxID=2487520 RepID=A0ABY1Z8Z2_9GAMM|nr:MULTISPECIES: DUF480 domain-containing protein [Pseudomonas]TBV07910.1 DUF480 domain-containing protein [Pseudomonas dryadis]TBV19305.1 DUF480 domain-containing protein [Pseudomonas sp. FRB 230]
MSDDTLGASGETPLTAVEARILGCLIEKQATTPEAYPLTLNALVLACNQKTSREPLMNLNPGTVGQGLRSLEGRGLARLVMGSRADRWEQRAEKTLELVAPQLILISLLLLRGPQTVNELLTRSNRLHDFEDAEQLQHHLERLMSRGLVRQIGRQPGQREDRYAQLLGDPAELQAQLESRASLVERPASAAAQEARIDALERRVAELEARLASLEEHERGTSLD